MKLNDPMHPSGPPMTLGKKDVIFSMAARNQETASNINATSPEMGSFTRGLTAECSAREEEAFEAACLVTGSGARHAQAAISSCRSGSGDHFLRRVFDFRDRDLVVLTAFCRKS
jgi:hypothetical protein